MNLNYFESIQNVMSKERLSSYGEQDNADEVTTLARYLWNMSVCESLYSPLQMGEVALRNAIHFALTKHFGSEEWYNQDLLDDYAKNQVKKARESLKKRKKIPTSGRMVTELHFGFWTSFFDKKNARSSIPSVVLKNCFRGAPKYMRRREVQHTRWTEIRRLRNRVFHHERIIHWSDIESKHNELVETIGWISRDLAGMMQKLDRFTTIYNGGIEPWKEKIKKHWS